MIRTEKFRILKSRASWPLALRTAAIMVAGTAIPFSQFAAWVGLVALPPAYFPWLLTVLAEYCMLVQSAKSWYVKRFAARL
jgi:Mg2+-importing ATPase